MPNDPADIAGRKIRLPRLPHEYVFDAGGERNRVSTRIALHAFGLTSGAAGVEDIARICGSHRFTGHRLTPMGLSRLSVIDVSPSPHGHIRQAAVHEHHRCGLMLGDTQGLV